MAEQSRESLKCFLWAHINKDSKNDFNLIYSWDVKDAWRVVDFTKAEMRFRAADKKIEYFKYSIKYLGDVINVTLPVFSKNKDVDFDKDKTTSIKDEYLKAINQYIKAWMFSDRRWTVISKMLENYDIVEYQGIIAFIELKKFNEDDIVFKSKTESFEFANSKFKLDVEDQSDIKDYEMVMLLIKEAQFWYYDVRTHSLVDVIEWQQIQQDYKIWRDVTIVMNWEKIVSVSQEDTRYTAVREKEWWFVITPDGEKISCIDFVPYSTTTDEDWNTVIKLVWAYTHMLRNMMDFKPLSWQYNMLMWQKRITFVAGCRRSWKSSDQSSPWNSWS